MQLANCCEDIKRGFSLAEIVLTLAIIGFVASLGIPILLQQREDHPPKKFEPHGTVECFWWSPDYANPLKERKLYKWTSDNKTNKEGTLAVLEDKLYCTMSVPTNAKKLFIQVIGAGGTGSAAQQDISSNTTIGYKINPDGVIQESGKIPIDGRFHETIHSEKVPNWVRTEWENMYDEKYGVNAYAQYYISSPIGAGGDGICKKYIKDKINPSCGACNNNIDTCPAGCIDYITKRGGTPGCPLFYEVRYKLTPNSHVQFITDKKKSEIRFDYAGSHKISVPASKPGGHATYNPQKPKDSTEGTDFWYNKSNKAKEAGEYITKNVTNTLPQYELKKYNKQFDKDVQNWVNHGCRFEENMGVIENPDPDYIPTIKDLGDASYGNGCNRRQAKDGYFGHIQPWYIDKNWTPGAYEYESRTPGIVATYGEAGKAGYVATRVLEINKDITSLILMPAKDAEDSSKVYIDNERILKAEGGNTGYIKKDQEFNIYSEADYPFPQSVYPEKFKIEEPQVSIGAGNLYKSKLKDLKLNNKYVPGKAGAGTYPIVTDVPGNIIHNIKYLNKWFEVNNKEMQKQEGGWAGTTCIDGTLPEKNVCGRDPGISGNAGAPGAVIVSW